MRCWEHRGQISRWRRIMRVTNRTDSNGSRTGLTIVVHAETWQPREPIEVDSYTSHTTNCSPMTGLPVLCTFRLCRQCREGWLDALGGFLSVSRSLTVRSKFKKPGSPIWIYHRLLRDSFSTRWSNISERNSWTNFTQTVLRGFARVSLPMASRRNRTRSIIL